LSIVEEVFVGREEEIEQFFEFLKKKDCPAFVVVGEPGIGKSSFLKEVADRLRSDDKFIVGFYEVPFSGGVANPFVGVLEELVDDLTARSKEQVRSVLKRIAEAGWKVAIKKGDRIARAFVKDLVTKLVGKHVAEELEALKKELDETPTIYSLADEFVREHRIEFIYDFREFFEELVREFPDREFVLLIDQFERAPMPSCDVFLDFVKGKHENVHVAVALKVEEKGYERFNYVKPHLERIGAEIVELPPLSVEEIGEWMRHLGKDFSYPELKKIERLSAGFPFAISEWLGTSKECDLSALEARRGKYCGFVESRVNTLGDRECRLVLRRLSVLLQPLPVEDYERLSGIEKESCGLFLNELVDKRILDKYAETFWFRHELIRFCVEQDLTEPEKRRYHEAVALFFQQKYDDAMKANEKVDFNVGLGCAYHLHFAGKHNESFKHNLQFASFCFNTGSLDVAEDCYLRTMEDAEALGDEGSKMAAKGNLANVYYIWGRMDEAFKTHSQLLEYFRKKDDKTDEAVALYQLAVIKQDRGNYKRAVELYHQSLNINKKLGNQEGIAESLNQLALIHFLKSEYGEAEKLFKQSLEILKTFGKQSSIAVSLYNLANIEQVRGNYGDAEKLYKKSLEIYQRLRNLRGMAESLHQLANIERVRGDYEKAIELYRQSLNITKRLGDQDGIAGNLHDLAIIHMRKGEYNEAEKLYEQSFDIRRKLGDQFGLARVLNDSVTIHLRRGDYEKAFELLKQCLNIFATLGDQRGIAASYGHLGLLHESLNKPTIAADYYLKALNIFQKIGDKLNATLAKADYERVTKQKIVT